MEQTKAEELQSSAEALYKATKDKKGYKGIYQRLIKRIVDIVACLVILPVVFLLAIPIAIIIKIEDGGSVFYRSRRIGKDFKEFDMLKFRSMRVGAPDLRNEDGSTYNSKTDIRVTKIGRFLRETSLDELPQFINVLIGHMSLVGDRCIIVTTRKSVDFSRVVTV